MCKVKTQVILKCHVLGPVLLNIKIKLQKENLLPIISCHHNFRSHTLSK